MSQQEELHSLNAAGALKSQGLNPIQTCQYAFPTTTFADAIVLANTFTDVVMGTLQDVIVHFANAGLAANAGGIGAVIGQEGEQTGFYRLLQGKVPSGLPFLTGGIRDFAFTILQSLSLPGSCPNIGDIKLTTFAPLKLLTTGIQAQDQNLKFSIDTNTLKDKTVTVENAASYVNYDYSKAAVVFINQQNAPLVKPIQSISQSGSVISFEANFPFSEFEMNGLTLALITANQGPFKNNQAVANATIFGPALIELN
jgi:hypothetical protein